MDPEHPMLRVEEFGPRYGFPIALVRLMIECGCPTQEGLIDYPSVVMWFLANSAAVRQRAGLPELPFDSTLTGRAAARVKIGNMFLTLMDYTESRTSDAEIKETAADTSELVLEIMRENPGASEGI